VSIHTNNNDTVPPDARCHKKSTRCDSAEFRESTEFFCMQRLLHNTVNIRAHTCTIGVYVEVQPTSYATTLIKSSRLDLSFTIGPKTNYDKLVSQSHSWVRLIWYSILELSKKQLEKTNRYNYEAFMTLLALLSLKCIEFASNQSN
jgi:hypothetical protein